MGVPSLGIFAGLLVDTGLGATTGHMDLSPVTPMTGEAVIEIFRTMTPAFRELGVRPWYGTTQSFHWRAFVTFYGFPVTHDAAQNQKTRAAYHKMIQLAAEHGWGLYRTHAAFQDAAVDAYSFNDHALLRLQERLKDAIDPDGVLSPGRYGLWPSHLRRART
jgi:4-cresol dehydrogenase (hydroxylating)